MLRRLWAFVLLFCLIPAAFAQAFPAKPLRMVIPWPPGGANDILGRALADSLTKAIGQNVVVDNRGGANGLIGAEVVAKAPPDGYTIMFHSISAHVTNPLLYKNVPYDTEKDFAPITQVAWIPLIIVANPSLPASSVAELIKVAKAQPGKLNFASFGNASVSHLAGELFNEIAGVNLVHVPYKGSGPAMTDTLGGQVQIFFASIAPSLPLIRSGKLRAIAVTGPQRSKQLPQVPTVAEQPGFEGYEAVGMFAVWAPGGTPAAIVSTLNQALRNAMVTAEFKERLEKIGASDPIGNSPEEMMKAIRADTAKYTRLIKAVGIQPE